MAKKSKQSRMTLLAATSAFAMLVGMSGGAFAATTSTLPSSGGLIVNNTFYSFAYIGQNSNTVQPLLTAAGMNNVILDIGGSMANFGAFVSSGTTPTNNGFTTYAAAHSATLPNNLTVDDYVNGATSIATYTTPASVSSVSAINSSVTFSSGTTVTDGSVYQLTAKVATSSGSAVTGLSNSAFVLNVGSSQLTAVSAIESPSGTYLVSFLPSTLANASNQSASLAVSGVTVGQIAGVSVGGGSVTQSGTTATFPNATVLSAGGQYQINLSVSNANGTPTSLPANSSADVTLGSGSSAVAVQNYIAPTAGSTTGQYSVVFTVPAGVSVSTAAPLVVKIGSVSVTSTGNYTISTSQVPTTITANVSNLPATLYTSASYTVPVTVTDANGQPISGLTLTDFTADYQGANISAANAALDSNNAPGVYDLTLTAVGTAGNVSKITFNYTATPIQSMTASSYTLAGTPVPVLANSSVTWQTATTLTPGSNYTATVMVEDNSSTPIANLPSSAFTIVDGATNATVNSVTPTSTAGQYTVSYSVPSSATGSQTYDLKVSGVKVGSETVTVNGSVATVVSGVAANSILVAGQSVTIPVTVEDSNSTAISGLTSSAFSVTYNGVPLSVTNVAAGSGKIYNVTFTTPTATNTTGENLVVSVSGTPSASVSGVTVQSASSLTMDAVAWTLAATSYTSGSTTYTNIPATGGVLSLGSTYYLSAVIPTAGGDPVLGLPVSDFAATLGSTSLTVSNAIQDLATAGTYNLIIQAPSTADTTAQPLTLKVDGVAQTIAAASYTTSPAQAASYNSSVTFPTGNAAGQLVAGQTYTITANVFDSSGIPITGLTSANFGIETSATQGTSQNHDPATYTPTLADLPIVTSALSVTAGSTAGSYTITFEPKTAANAAYMDLVVDNAPTVGTPGQLATDPTATAAVLASSVQDSVVAGAAANVVVTPATAAVAVAPATTDVVTATVKDANGNVIVGASVNWSVSKGTDAGTVGTLSATSSVTNAAGQATVTYTEGTGGSTSTDNVSATVGSLAAVSTTVAHN